MLNYRSGGATPDTMEFSRQMAPYCAVRRLVCNPNDRYRTTDSCCNNLNNPLWRASITNQARFLSPTYVDPYNTGSIPRIRSVIGPLLSSPRDVSNAVLNGGVSPPRSRIFSVSLTHFGQVVDHDFISTPILKESRNQINQWTSFLDLSVTYGNTLDGQNDLRELGTGRLQESINKLLPNGPPGSECLAGEECFKSGDNRPAEVPMLTVVHTAFLREHNNIVERLRALGWNDGEVFTRSIRDFTTFGPDTIARWMTTQFKSRSDRFLTPAIRNRLFQTIPGNGFDFGSLNIQRGIDHGIPSYNRWRQFCGLQPALHF
ncbi:PXDN [Mytilus coruscus]|uniref:PXDN n=1 Tax=Mytilus coruscus TaxID=42192 RepID=A0A6J8AMY4_MYTCO|nr:PXDN [Mytilus coruscus]